MRDAILSVFSEVFGHPPEAFGDDPTPGSVEGWNSTRHVELVVALEERFDCTFEPEEVPDLTSLQQIEEILTRHGQALT